MKITIVGCGKIGRSIIDALSNEKHDILAIDNNPQILKDVTERYDVMGACANGTDADVLKDAGVENTDLFIAVTSSDEINMLCCFVAKRLGAKHTVARIRDLENNDSSMSFMKEQLELSMSINPELMLAQEIANIINLPSASKVETFSSKNLEMIELTLPKDSVLNGVSMQELRKKQSEHFLIPLVLREGKPYIPKGDFVLMGGDKIGLIASKKDTHKILSSWKLVQKQVKSIMIIGGGRVTTYLIKLLGNKSVKVIEKNETACERLCENAGDNVSVINGNGMSREILMEENFADSDAFVALTGQDEQNILISYYAQTNNIQKIITKANSDVFTFIAEKMGLDSILSTKKTVADLIVKYVRALNNSGESQIETLYSLFGGVAEAIEFKVLDDFDKVNIPLKELKIENNVLLAGIIRKKDAIIPSGDDVLKAGDNVIVIATGKRLSSLDDVIQG